ncbi:hypothetical protein BDR22DRAFT_964409 [Usnea florida]
MDSGDDVAINVEPDSDDDQDDTKADDIPEIPTSTPKATMVRLAHFLVKEYLVSDRIHTGSAAFFGIDEEASNTVIGAICFSCLHLYGQNSMTPILALASLRVKWRSATAPASSCIRTVLVWREIAELDSSSRSRYGCSLVFRINSLLEAQIQLQKDKTCPVGVSKDSKLRCPDTDDTSSILKYAGNNACLVAALFFWTGGTARKLLEKGLYPACFSDALILAAFEEHKAVVRQPLSSRRNLKPIRDNILLDGWCTRSKEPHGP